MFNDTTAMDIQRIKDILPHRYPFLLVDKVISIEEKKIHAIKNVTINEEFFMGHFPERPVMPGVLIIEAMAQTSVLLVADKLDPNFLKEHIFFFGSIENARFLKPVLPGDTLHLYIEELQARSNIWKMKGEAFVDNKKVSEAKLSAVVTKKA